MTANELQPFCAPSDMRPAIQTPWSVGDYTYACDGRILLRVPRLPDVPVRTDGPPPETIAELLTHPEPATWVLLPALEPAPEPEKCRHCNGTGQIPLCPECHGYREVEWTYETWTRWAECPRCNGRLFDGVLKPGETLQTCECDCEHGYIPVDEPPTRVAGVLLNMRYLRMVAALPGVEIGALGDRAAIRWPGGVGLVMTLRDG